PIAYPKSVAFIISNEFCERFNYYGMRTILVLYLTTKLGYNEETSTVLFHVFTMLVYIFPLIGALIADGWLGKYRTILYLSLVYSLGALVVSFGAIPLIGMPTKTVTIVGLLLIAVGTGGIKPCVSAFGGDQFSLPEQSLQLAKFFSLFYFAINAGSMISTTVTPILRADVHCFGDSDCFSLAFGVPAILMIISVVIFVFGKKLYTREPPAGNMIFGVSRCLSDAFNGWCKRRRTDPQKSFLDYARPTVGSRMVNETKCLARILRLYLPFPVFWALFDQQGSRWTFQANRMDGVVMGYRIKPDQMQVVNPLLILAFIPLFDYVVYPLLRTIGIRRPLQKLSIGLMLAALGFFFSAALEMKMEQVAYISMPSQPDGAHLRLYNGMQCKLKFISQMKSTPEQMPRAISPLSMWSDLSLFVSEPAEYGFQADSTSRHKCPVITGSIRVEPGKSLSYYLVGNEMFEFNDGLEAPPDASSAPHVRVLLNVAETEGPVLLRAINSDGSERQPAIVLSRWNVTQVHTFSAGYGEIEVNGVTAAQFNVKEGGLYTLMVTGNSEDGYEYNMLNVIVPGTVNILWQLPQIVVMTMAEIMFSVTGLEFSFTQAPASMKSVLQACWLLSVAIGNMIVVIIAEFKFAETQAGEFVLFACLMLVDMVLFLWLTRGYRYMDQSGEDMEYQDEDAGSLKPEKPPPPPRILGMEAEPGYGAYRNHAYDNDFSEA
ncbi:hypothetical protein KR018_012557, partial [Drosophila ironensis]